MSLKSFPKGQKEPKADWRAIDSPKKRTNEFVFVCRENKKTKNYETIRHWKRSGRNVSL